MTLNMPSSVATLCWSSLLQLVLVSCTATQTGCPSKLAPDALKMAAITQPDPILQFALKRKHSKYDFAGIGKRKVAEGLNFYSWEAERKLGMELAALIDQDSDLITDSAITAYVDRLERKIADNSDYRGPLTVKIVNDIEPNAYTVAGGIIYLHTGIIIAAENEAEFASVLAHETGHVAARHMTRLITKLKTWRTLSLALGGPAGYLFAKKGLPVFIMRSMRDSEFEADLLGLEYEYASGYDPNEFVLLLRIVDEDDKNDSLWDRLVDSHPLTGTRIRRAQSNIARYLPTRTEYISDTSEFEEMKARVAKLMGLKDSDWKSVKNSKFAGESFQPLLRQP